jgi:hypothetical protein
MAPIPAWVSGTSKLTKNAVRRVLPAGLRQLRIQVAAVVEGPRLFQRPIERTNI